MTPEERQELERLWREVNRGLADLGDGPKGTLRMAAVRRVIAWIEVVVVAAALSGGPQVVLNVYAPSSVRVVQSGGSGCLGRLSGRPPAVNSRRTRHFFRNGNVHRPHGAGSWTITGKSGQ